MFGRQGNLLRRQPEEAVRFLAPFDPLVWDRLRFEHFWGWAYRFEALYAGFEKKARVLCDATVVEA